MGILKRRDLHLHPTAGMILCGQLDNAEQGSRTLRLQQNLQLLVLVEDQERTLHTVDMIVY